MSETTPPILYTTHCPKCRVLVSKLTEKGINFAEETDENVMRSLGITDVPVLRVGERFLQFSEAIRWLQSQ